MRKALIGSIAVVCLGLGFRPSTASGQATDSRLAQASREQIKIELAEAEKIVTSSGYSGRIKDTKRREIALLKSRLDDGDLQAGDQVILTVLNEPTLTGTFVVAPGRLLTLPGVGDITLKGVLRSEVPGYLTAELKKYLKDPTVRAQTTMRLSFLGGIGRPGYYQMPAEILVDSAIMAAGGPPPGVDPSNSKILRNGEEVLTKEAFRQAVVAGRTLDQLNLRAGDEIIVGGKRTTNTNGQNGALRTLLPFVSVALSLSYLAVRLLGL